MYIFSGSCGVSIIFEVGPQVMVRLSSVRLVNSIYKQNVTGIKLNEPRQANLCLRAFRHDKF